MSAALVPGGGGDGVNGLSEAFIGLVRPMPIAVARALNRGQVALVIRYSVDRRLMRHWSEPPTWHRPDGVLAPLVRDGLEVYIQALPEVGVVAWDSFVAPEGSPGEVAVREIGSDGLARNTPFARSVAAEAMLRMRRAEDAYVESGILLCPVGRCSAIG